MLLFAAKLYAAETTAPEDGCSRLALSVARRTVVVLDARNQNPNQEPLDVFLNLSPDLDPLRDVLEVGPGVGLVSQAKPQSASNVSSETATESSVAQPVYSGRAQLTLHGLGRWLCRLWLDMGPRHCLPRQS